MSTDVDRDILRDFSVRGARRCAELGRLEDWIHAYLRGGAWANLPLSRGLKRKKRFWVGPAEVRLDNIDRHCGPEFPLTYWEPREQWERRVAELMGSIVDVLDLPPLIIESRNGIIRNPDGTFRFLIADGTHRLEALRRMGHETAHVLIWFESARQRAEYLAQEPSSLSPARCPG